MLRAENRPWCLFSGAFAAGGTSTHDTQDSPTVCFAPQEWRFQFIEENTRNLSLELPTGGDPIQEPRGNPRKARGLDPILLPCSEAQESLEHICDDLDHRTGVLPQYDLRVSQSPEPNGTTASAPFTRAAHQCGSGLTTTVVWVPPFARHDIGDPTIRGVGRSSVMDHDLKQAHTAAPRVPPGRADVSKKQLRDDVVVVAGLSVPC